MNNFKVMWFMCLVSIAIQINGSTQSNNLNISISAGHFYTLNKIENQAIHTEKLYGKNDPLLKKNHFSKNTILKLLTKTGKKRHSDFVVLNGLSISKHNNNKIYQELQDGLSCFLENNSFSAPEDNTDEGKIVFKQNLSEFLDEVNEEIDLQGRNEDCEN